MGDVTVGSRLLHGQEVDAFGDAGYQGISKRADAKPRHSAHRHEAGQASNAEQGQGLRCIDQHAAELAPY
jgi:hypothetical protein